MIEPKHILCIAPEPTDLSVGVLLEQRGILVDLTEASFRETLRGALERPGKWDLILCDALRYQELGVETLVESLRGQLDASLVLLTSADSQVQRKALLQLGSADLVARDDKEHLLMVCERELVSCAMRKEIRGLRRASHELAQSSAESIVLPTIQDLSPAAHNRVGHLQVTTPSPPAMDPARIRSLIDSGGLVLEFQPIIWLRGNEANRGMFETLVRLRDESGGLLMPGEFLPVVATAGWMSKIDLWILRRALSTLQEMQTRGGLDAVLFINVATETLCAESTAKAIGAFISVARITPGSVVVEVRKSAFTEAADALGRLTRLLKAKQHGLLVEDAGIEDCPFIKEHRDLITHIKLERAMMQGLVERYVSQEAVNTLVGCAKHEGMRVIALAVDNAALLPMLFGAGVDAIQGHFISMPYQNLMYPSIQRVEASAAPAWHGKSRNP